MRNFRKLSVAGTNLLAMKAFRSLTAVLGISLVATALVLPISVSRAEILSEQSYSNNKVIGLVIQYRDSINPIDSAGNLVGIAPIKEKISSFADLGLGMWSVRFSADITEKEARQQAAKLQADPRIKRIYLDHLLTEPKALSSPKLGALRSSSAPSGLIATDAWNLTSPQLAQLKLAWNAPTKLNGGSIWGYRVSHYDLKTNSWLVIVGNTKSRATSMTVSKNLIAGQLEKFKIAAITKSANGKLMAVSGYSAPASFRPTTAPKPPVLQSSGQVTSTNPNVSWLSQTDQEKGGLATSYSVTASATDKPTVNCSTSGTSCMLSGLQAQVRYSVVVTATNAKGSANSLTVVETADPMFNEQWYLTAQYGINVQPAWNITKGNPAVVVAVIDSGITKHPDLDENVVAGYDFILSDSNSRDNQPGRDADPTDPGDYSNSANRDSSWHGTHVAGIIAASSNSIGITGIAPRVKISPIRVLGVNGGTESDIAAGINWAIGIPISGVPNNQNVAKVINLSIGSKVFSTCGRSSPTQVAIDASKLKNVTIVTAAGNENKNATESYPGNCSGNITIGATGYFGDRTDYSNHSYWDANYDAYFGVDISAPGGDQVADGSLPADGGILSTWNDGKTGRGSPTYESEVGTSMASPIAAGVLALMYSIRPNLTEDQAWDILRTTAKPFAPGSTCQDLRATPVLTDGTEYATGYCGAGIIDAGKALEATLNLK